MSARGFAHCGPAGELNTHIAATLRSPHAQQTWVRWANAWAGQALPAVVRQPWLRMIGIGGDKGGGKARPIVFQEVLFKLAASTIARAEGRA
eukprot:6939680-Alexandrium_andersonii.AAC.1